MKNEYFLTKSTNKMIKDNSPIECGSESYYNKYMYSEIYSEIIYI